MNETSFQQQIQSLQSQTIELREEMDCVRAARPRLRRDPDPGFVFVREAAKSCGRTLQCFETWIKRLARDPDSMPLRQVHGRIHLGDLKKVLEATRMVGLGERVSRALRKAGAA